MGKNFKLKQLLLQNASVFQYNQTTDQASATANDDVWDVNATTPSGPASHGCASALQLHAFTLQPTSWCVGMCAG